MLQGYPVPSPCNDTLAKHIVSIVDTSHYNMILSISTWGDNVWTNAYHNTHVEYYIVRLNNIYSSKTNIAKSMLHKHLINFLVWNVFFSNNKSRMWCTWIDSFLPLFFSLFYRFFLFFANRGLQCQISTQKDDDGIIWDSFPHRWPFEDQYNQTVCLFYGCYCLLDYRGEQTVLDDFMTWNGFHITGPLCGESTGIQWLLSQMQSFDVVHAG